MVKTGGGTKAIDAGSDGIPSEVKAVNTLKKREQTRVSRTLRRDRQDAAAEDARIAAEAEVAAGKFANIAATRIGPTREHAAKVEFEPFTADKVLGTVRTVETVRRVSVNRVKQLHDRGVFTDDTYPAVLWYQRMWENAGFVIGASAASWGDAVRGEPAYGVMPKTAVAAECREMFRFARGGRRLEADDGEVSFETWSLPPDMLPTFDNVVLCEMTIAEAAAAAKCRYSNAAAAVRHVALMLLGRIEHWLPVRAVGAPGSAPDEAGLDRLRKVEAMRDGAATDGERDAAIAALDRIRANVPAEFLNARGFMRPAAVIAKILRGEELTEEEMEL